MSKIKVGIIGTGQVAQAYHIPAFRSYNQSVEMVAICGRDKGKTKKLATELEIDKAYSDPDKMLAENSLDIISVCSPNNLHYQHTMRALNAGCHVLCEKPPALSYAEAKAMQEKSRAAQKVLCYNLRNRQLKETEILKGMIDAGEFGIVYHINARFIRRRGIPGWGSFTNKDVQGGGALMDIGIHALDLALYLLDYPEVNAVLGNTYNYIGKIGGVGLMGDWDPKTFTVEDSCFAHISFKNGSSITLETAFALNVEKEQDFNLQIHGSKSGASLIPLKVFTEKENKLTDIDLFIDEEINTYEKNIHKFIDTCLGQTTSVCNAQQGTTLQKIIEGIYHSADTKKSISFS